MRSLSRGPTLMSISDGGGITIVTSTKKFDDEWMNANVVAVDGSQRLRQHKAVYIDGTVRFA